MIASRGQAESGLIHLVLNVTALVLFIINALIHTGNWEKPSGAGSGIILTLIGVLCTVGAGYFEWTMIQTDHVGVELSPEAALWNSYRSTQRILPPSLR